MTIRVEYLRRTMLGQGLFQGLDAKVSIHAVGQPPGQELAAVPVHDCHEIQEATPHRDISDICAPDLVRPVDHHIPQQIGPDLMLRVFLAGIGLLIDRHQPHEAHQSADTMTPAFVIVALHVSGHLARSVPRRLQELLVDDRHEPQVLCALALRLIVQIRRGQREQRALTTHAQLVILAHHFLPRVPSNWCEASAKKSRSTTSWPILECSFSTIGSATVCLARDLGASNADAMFSSAARFQVPI